ncbi:hypothetical protein RFI_38908, partial [Reticulomyxa filosa]
DKSARISVRTKIHLIPDVKLQTFGNELESGHEYVVAYKNSLQKQLQIIRDGAIVAQNTYNANRTKFENKKGTKIILKSEKTYYYLSEIKESEIKQNYYQSLLVHMLLSKIKSKNGLKKIVHVSKLRKLHSQHSQKELEEDIVQEPSPLEPLVKIPHPWEQMDDKSLHLEPPPLEPLNASHDIDTYESLSLKDKLPVQSKL